MLRKSGVGNRRAVVITLSAVGLAAWTQAAWIGAGTADGDTAATNFNDTANWQDGVINGDFRTVVSNVDLLLSADYTATNGLDFGQAAAVLRHITLSGTNTLALNGKMNYYSFNYGQPTQVFLPSNTASTVTLNRGLTLNLPAGTSWNVRGAGTLFVDAKVTGGGSLQTGTGSGSTYIVLRNDTNGFTGAIGGDTGRYNFTSIGNSGVPSAAGVSGGMDPNNSPVAYIGSRSRSTNRSFTFNNGGSRLINDSACGSLNMLGIVRPSTWFSPGTPMNFDGLSSGELLVTNNLVNFDATHSAKLRKYGSGTLRLTGKNTFTGITNSAYHVEILGGTLLADYVYDTPGAGSNRLFAAGRNFYFYDGTLAFRGKSGTGNTTWQELGTNTVVEYSSNVLAVDANGGDGTTVVLNALVMDGAGGFLRLEKSSNAVIRTTAAIPSDIGSVRLVNGVLMAVSGARANVLVKDPDGRVGFASQNGDLELARNTNVLALTGNNATKTDHVSLASDLTRSANLNFSTLDVDASANPVTLDLNGFLFQNDNSTVGRGVVVGGNNPVTVRGGSHGAQGSTFIHHYGTETLSWELTNGTCTYVTAGKGLIRFTQPLGADLHVVGCTTRLTAENNYTAGTVRLFGNGVLEVGADLNGTTAGDFTRTVIFASGGGFSAYGAVRTVNLNAGAAITWPSDGNPFVLSSPFSDATLLLANPISLGERAREFRVQNGSAAVDACLTNRIYGTRVSALIKSGAGTLELTGRQDYRGDCSVIGGGLRLGADDVFAGGTNALVLSGATLDAGTARNTFDTLEVLTDSVIEAGSGSATLAFADSSAKTWTGTLTINGKLAATTLRFGTDAKGLTAAQLAAISNRDRPVTLDAQGYLRQIPGGTVLSLW